MKSYINKLADYKQAEFEKRVYIDCPKDYIEKQFHHITRAYKKTQQVDSVERGDVAVMSLSSELPRFNKQHIPVTVGGDLLSPEMEKQIIGHNVAESFDVTVEGKRVTVTIESCKRFVFPMPTDEMVREAAGNMDGMEGITTVEDYRKKIVDTYKEEKKQDAISEAINQTIEYVLTHSDWEFNDHEVEELYKDMIEETKASATETFGKSFEEVSDQEMYGYTGLETKEALLEELHIQVKQQIAMALFIGVNHGYRIEDITLENADGMDWDFIQDYVESQMEFIEE